jgi:hypothetical protein
MRIGSIFPQTLMRRRAAPLNALVRGTRRRASSKAPDQRKLYHKSAYQHIACRTLVRKKHQQLDNCLRRLALDA